MALSVLVCPDSFKGCAGSLAVSQAIARGVHSVWPDAVIGARPLSDGGEGLLSALKAASTYASTAVVVSGPYGAPTRAEVLCQGEEAVVEMATAAGLSLSARREPLLASSAGVGALLAAADALGVRRICLGVGGSATVDGGVGALSALGFRCLDATGAPLASGGGALTELAAIHPPPHPLKAHLELWCDVTNPLLGPKGAAAVFGPQKGAGPREVERLEAGLKRLAAVLTDAFGFKDFPGAGAGGGLAAGLAAALGATVVSGQAAVAARLHLEATVSGAQVIFTGEGRLDDQTSGGKTLSGVVALAKTHRRPLVAVVGEATAAGEAWLTREGGVAVPVVDGPRTLAEALDEALPLIERAAARAARLLSAGAALTTR